MSSSPREHLSTGNTSLSIRTSVLPLRGTPCHGHCAQALTLSLLSPHPNPPHFPHPSSQSAPAAEVSPPVSPSAQTALPCLRDRTQKLISQEFKALAINFIRKSQLEAFYSPPPSPLNPQKASFLHHVWSGGCPPAGSNTCLCQHLTQGPLRIARDSTHKEKNAQLSILNPKLCIKGQGKAHGCLRTK